MRASVQNLVYHKVRPKLERCLTAQLVPGPRWTHCGPGVDRGPGGVGGHLLGLQVLAQVRNIFLAPTGAKSQDVVYVCVFNSMPESGMLEGIRVGVVFISKRVISLCMLMLIFDYVHCSA